MDIYKEIEREREPDKVEGSPKLRRRLIKLGGIISLILGLAILIYPFIPYLEYQFFPPKEEEIIESEQPKKNEGFLSRLPIIGSKFKEDLSGNRLIISKIGVNTKIVEGENEKALLRGAWRYPNDSYPGNPGNVVITGHRFRFLPPNNTTFYLLDKLAVNDEIKVNWEGEEYNYRVKEMKVVNPDQVEILNDTDQSVLTLYTCTPLFTTKQRLVIISELI